MPKSKEVLSSSSNSDSDSEVDTKVRNRRSSYVEGEPDQLWISDDCLFVLLPPGQEEEAGDAGETCEEVEERRVIQNVQLF